MKDEKMSLAFGHDLPDRLLLSNWFKRDFLKIFKSELLKQNNNASLLFRGIFLNNEKYLKRSGYNYKIIDKNDNYNLENALIQYGLIQYGYETILILKNKKWYKCSDYIMVPCQGEYADLSDVHLEK